VAEGDPSPCRALGGPGAEPPGGVPGGEPGPTVGDHGRAGGLRMVAGALGAERTVSRVRLLEGVSPTAFDRGALSVLVWRSARRGAPLSPLRPLISRAATEGAAGLVIIPPGRRVDPPADAVDLANEWRLPVLWAEPGADPLVVLERLGRVAFDAQARAPEDRGGLAQVLRGELELHPLVERLALQLRAGVRVTDVGAAPLAEHFADPGSLPDGLEPVLVPLVHRDRQVGTLAVYRLRELADAERTVIQSIGPVLVLALRVQATEDESEAPARECLAAILGEDLTARESAVRRSKRLVLFPARPTVFVVVMPFGVTVGRVGLDRLSRLFESPAKALDRRALLLVHEGAVVLLVSEHVDLDLLVRGLNRRAPVALSVGSSRPVTDVRGFAGAFRQAQRATTIGRRIGTANRVNRYHDLGVYRLLYQLPEHERRAFVQETLGTVAGTDQEAVESRRVLRSFRRTNGNVAESARQLFLHHNTFRQRLAKLQSVLGDFLGDADLRLAVFVALDLHRLDNDLEG
jgi:hypothetical protein